MMTANNGHISVDDVKSAARGRWRNILIAHGFNSDKLDGQHHPCPKCQGTDRFRAFDDVDETGGVICNQCFNEKNGDGLAAVEWRNGWDFPTTLKAVAAYLNVGSGERKPVDIVADVARAKRMPVESFRAFGAKPDHREQLEVARVPMFGPDRKDCSYFDLALISPKFEKGMNAARKPAGLFVPTRDDEASGTKRRVSTWPEAGETVLVTEGVKDSAALHSLRFSVVGLPTSKLAKKFVQVFAGCHVIIVPDRDKGGEDGAQVTAARLAGVAASARIATLPGELKAKDGDGVREVLAMKDGEALLRQAITDAKTWTPATKEDASPIYVPPTTPISANMSVDITPPRILAAGERVLAGDKGNIGTVVNDDGGSSVTVHFVSPEGKEATKDIHRSQLKTADGRSVVPVQPIRIRAAGELIGEFSEMRPAILEGLLRCGETMNIIAAPKTGKSWLSAGLGLSVVSGRKWLDRFWTRRGKVLIVDNELHPETSAQRLPHIAREMGIQRDEYADQLFVANLRGQLIDLEALAEQLSRLEPGAYSMIVLDAWYRFQPSGSDENSNGDVTQLYNLLDSVADKIGSAFVCIHHSSKGNQSGKGVTDVGSGAGAQSRAPDSHLTIRQHEEDGAVVVEAAVRSFAPMEPFCLRWNFPVWTPANDLDPKDLRQERPRKAKGSATESDESPEDLRKQRDQENRQKVLDAYATFPDGETASVVKNAAGMNGSVFGPIHAQLIRDGLVRTCKIQKNRQAYDGACLVKPKPLGHSDKTLFSVSESECPTEGGIGTRTSRPPLGAAVCPSPHPQVGGLVCLPVGKESECPSEIAHELANELFPVEAT